jgi:RNA polymerase sigma-70 factor, ECF subfamily
MDDLTRSFELVRLAQNGDDDALNRLLDRYYERVRRVVQVRLGKRLRGKIEIDDILQETFVAAVESFERFEMREEASLINWLAKLAERKIIAAADHYSAKKRDRRREVRLPSAYDDGSGAPLGELADSVEAPADEAAQGELRELVEDCLADLPEDYRELILLRDYMRASWDEVASETGRPSPEAARMMHSRALLELARQFRSRGVR